MFHNLGIQWAGTLLGCLSAIMIPIPVVFYLYGHKIRSWSKNTGMAAVADEDEEETPGVEKDD
jgi:hypothetical protein